MRLEIEARDNGKKPIYNVRDADTKSLFATTWSNSENAIHLAEAINFIERLKRQMIFGKVIEELQKLELDNPYNHPDEL